MNTKYKQYYIIYCIYLSLIMLIMVNYTDLQQILNFCNYLDEMSVHKKPIKFKYILILLYFLLLFFVFWFMLFRHLISQIAQVLIFNTMQIKLKFVYLFIYLNIIIKSWCFGTVVDCISDKTID